MIKSNLEERRQRDKKVLKLMLVVLPKVEGVCDWGKTSLFLSKVLIKLFVFGNLAA